MHPNPKTILEVGKIFTYMRVFNLILKKGKGKLNFRVVNS